MSEIEYVLDQLKRAQEGDAWHGRSLREVLDRVTAEQAAERPIAGAHSIWEIVRHVAAWEMIVGKRFTGERIVDVSADEDWPPLRETTDAAWKQTLKELGHAHRKVYVCAIASHERKFGQEVAGKEYSHRHMLHGLVQHDLYYAGQIAILKKAFTQ